MPNLKIDDTRALPRDLSSGFRTDVYVRAQEGDGRWRAADLTELSAESARSWIESLDRAALERLVMHLLGHET